MIIAFPRDRCRVSGGKIRGPRCSIVILPVIRIERWPEKSTAKRAPRKARITTKITSKIKTKSKRKTTP
jgi:hypothetical protein